MYSVHILFFAVIITGVVSQYPSPIVTKPFSSTVTKDVSLSKVVGQGIKKISEAVRTVRVK